MSAQWSLVNTHIVLQEALDGPVHLGGDVGASDLAGKEPQAQADRRPHSGSHRVYHRVESSV